MFTLLKTITQSKRYLTYSASTLLNNENKEICMRKFQDMLIKQGTKETTKRAAVLIPIYVNANEVSLLYTHRAANLRTHRGQISFPGGMVDQVDSSLEHTALRETHEELGISPSDIEIWGHGNPIIRQDLSVVPIIGCIKEHFDLERIYLNTNEVEDVFTVKIQDLVDLKYHRHTQFRGTYSTPTYFGGPYRIWGLTAVITYMFLKALLPSTHYTYKIKHIPDVLKIIAKRNR